MFVFQKIAEKRIKEAQERGDFDDLPGHGEPINKILKNAGCLPPELQLRKDIRQMEDMLDNIPDEKEKYRQIKKINFKIMQLNMMGKGSPLMGETEIYYKKLLDKVVQK